MALDPRQLLLRGTPAQSSKLLIRQVSEALRELALDRRLAAVDEPPMLVELATIPGDARGALYIPVFSPPMLAVVANRLGFEDENPYAVLADAGILFLEPRGAAGGGTRLAGGSYCEVTLEVSAGVAKVVKRYTSTDTGRAADGERRHRNEAHWLASVSAHSELFLPVRVDAEVVDGCRFESPFFPAYSLAEALFQRRLTGFQAAQTLVDIYRQLGSTLYSEPPFPALYPDPDTNYVEKIRRRFGRLRAQSSFRETELGALVGASDVTINGRRCPPAPALLRMIDERLMVWADREHACHGDLILEDVLVSEGESRMLRLVDPNPYNRHCVFDLAKTMLSLWLGYEFVYFDYFTIVTERSGEGVRIDIDFGAPDVQRQYAQALAAFLAFVESEFAEHHRPGGLVGESIRQLAALMAMAIAPFHFDNGRPDRALAFMALGMLFLTETLGGGEQVLDD